MNFIHDDIDGASWESIEPYMNDLRDRTLSCSNCLETFIADRSNLSEVISEARARLYIDMTCHTDDEDIQKAWMAFVENVQPKLSEYSDILNRRLIEHKAVQELPERFDILVKGLKTDIEIFREENIPLNTQATKLVTEYNEICGAQMVEFDDEQKTFAQMAIYLENTERSIREAAWKAVSERRFEDNERISEIYDELIQIRHQIATNAGYEGFQQYMFASMHRYDYTIEDCLEFHDSIESVCQPLRLRTDEEREKELGLGSLRPWDMGVDVKGRPPLQPFNEVQEMVDGCSRIFHTMSEELGNYFDQLDTNDCLDLDSRKGKAPGGYQYYLQKSRMPFIFMNAAGTQRNVETMIHEAGHAFHSFYSGHLDLIHERDSPIEFAEVASMSMELLTHPHWEEFYDAKNADRARRKHLEDIISFMPWMATIDAFQYWVYANPNHSREERAERWLELAERFGPKVDMSGFEEIHKVSWQRQGHLFGVPFYYVEYGIAQLGALQMWKYHRRDTEDALTRYKAGLSLGYTRGLTELFEASGLELSFSESYVGSLIGEIDDALAEIPA
ncbi:MAG: M3 family oligoendopeptidase [Candidatus Thermoplasmatota archaeon]|nr:M3 family oligoendopeptidase [Candidatus Thermoplasmatota archaeon]MEC8954363.1 M3 family oligoendopeptidase [Candidatus Thermoplasmatota archaeon]MEE3200584.1 M3 family oligoendopeptidase [Candidatus Thermoplasmatota archaeon]MEE3303814.1 M3 family oligoendopeptidase [Candidatus Thermoplasmatota archaeon]